MRSFFSVYGDYIRLKEKYENSSHSAPTFKEYFKDPSMYEGDLATSSESESDQLTECTPQREQGKILCPEGTYELTSGKLGKEIHDDLGRIRDATIRHYPIHDTEIESDWATER